MRKMAGLALLIGLIASCSPPAAPTSSSPTPSPSAASSEGSHTEDSAIVGEWRGAHECAGIIDALSQAGFSGSVVVENLVGNGLLPAGSVSAGDLADPSAACADAVTLEHSHVFTADGQFQSLDPEGNQVDFGTWEAIDADTIVIGAPDRVDVSFDYNVQGDRLTLEPQLEPGCQSFECQWAVMVAMGWSGMERVGD